MNIDHDEVLGILKKKETLGELIGISLTWEESGIGGEFLFRSDGTISINLSLNTRRDPQTGFTDINWYINKLVNPLSRLTKIESLRFTEIRS